MSEYPDFNFPNFKQFIASVDSNQSVTNETPTGRPSWGACAVGHFNNSLENPFPLDEKHPQEMSSLIQERFPLKLYEHLNEGDFYTYGEIKQFIIDNEL